MITRRFATYNFVCKRWNDACYTSIIPNLELFVDKFEHTTQIRAWLERIAMPPAGQIRQIRIHESTWKMIVRHLEDIASRYRLSWFPQITHFATAFCRLQKIQYDMLPITGNFTYSTLENAIQLRELRWWPLLNTMRPRFTQADHKDFSRFITEQRRLAGMEPCCTSCIAERLYFASGDTDHAMDTHDALSNLAEKGLAYRSHLICPPGDHHLHVSCPERIEILPYKTIMFNYEDAEVDIRLWPDTKTMSFDAATIGNLEGRQAFPRSNHCGLPHTGPGALKEVVHYVERKLVNYLRDVGTISAFPDEIEDEARGGCPELPKVYPELHRDAYRSWWAHL